VRPASASAVRFLAARQSAHYAADVFTGIVEEIGALVSRTQRGPGARLFVRCAFPELVLGESIAVNGICLTVDERPTGGGFFADASAETLARTTLGALPLGAPVNLERAVTPTTRLGGHFVTGHVDATAELLSIETVGDARRLSFSLPRALESLVAEKGSITVDGVSLTVNALLDGPAFSLVAVPHTFARTTLAARRVGDRVNLEADVLARYVARQLRTSRAAEAPVADESSAADERWMAALSAGGFLGR
jgi:riboflavin synthase